MGLTGMLLWCGKLEEVQLSRKVDLGSFKRLG